ncbi:MAG: hypothetical protein ACRD10_00575 [Terriglobia bacterium]
MHWALAGLALVVTGYVCRRILRLDEPHKRRPGLVPLPADREEIYQPIALEIETQTVILGVSLNEALGERDSGNPENAWRLVRLAVSQWGRLSETLIVLLNSITENMPYARSVVAVRNIGANRFKSRGMIEFGGMREMLDQLIFRSKPRYQTHIRVLRRALELLTAEFHRSYRTAEQAPEASAAMWTNLDPDFHDFDLLIKETLLAFRAFLIALPAATLPAFADDLKVVVSKSVRSKAATVPHPAED